MFSFLRRVYFIGTAVLLVTVLPLHAQTPPASESTWQELLAQAKTANNTAGFDSALVIAKQALDVAERTYGKNDTSVARVLHVTGILTFDHGRYADAEPLCRRALAIRERALGPDHPEVARSLNFLANICLVQGRYAEAEPLHLRALSIREKALGPDHTDVAMSLVNLSNLYQSQGRYSEAEPLLRRALIIQEKSLGPDHVSVALNLNNLGNLLYSEGHYAESEPLHQRALAIREKALGPDHPDVAQSLNNLAILYFDQGRFAEAEPLCERAIRIRENTLTADHPDLAVSLNTLANLYMVEGRYSEAEPLHQRALALREKVLGPDHLDVAQSLGNLAIVYYDQGRYSEAEPLHQRAMAIREKILGNDHPNLATSLNNLANLYLVQGRYDDAEPLYRRTLNIREKALGREHPDVAQSLNNLAILYIDEGRFAEAEPLYKRALEIREKALSSLHPDLATALNNLANLYMIQSRYAEAEPLHKRALAIREKALGPDHLDVAQSLSNLAILYNTMDRGAEAEPLCERALGIEENAVGSQHPSAASTLCALAEAAWRQGHFPEAIERESRAWNIRRHNFYDGSYVLAERNALENSQFMSKETSSYLTILLASPDGAFVNSQEISRVVFSTKSQVTDCIMARHRSVVQETEPGIVALGDSLKRARFALSNLYVKGPDDKQPGAFKLKLQTATAEKERLEAELARSSASFAQEQALRDVSASDVSEALPQGAVLVEYAKYYHCRSFKDTKPSYLAIVLKKGSSPSVFPLGDAAAIDTAVLYYRQQFRDGQNVNQTVYASVSDNLFSLVWRPFAALVKNASTVFIAPDGDLSLVSFAGLLDDDRKYLIEKYPIHYLASGRDLIRMQDKAPSGSGLLAMGDPDFERLSQSAPAASISVPLVLAAFNLRSSCEALNKLRVAALPGTRREVESVVMQWKRSGAEAALACFDSGATEECFKQQAPGKRVIHLATHGFYISEECKPIRSLHALQESLESSVGENPFLQSGFLLAGANRHGNGANEPGGDDGIVTAEAVAAMNLQGTDLVVLSACETGLGAVKSGEGVYGLRRAFQVAGARTVISALWPIDDKATAEFMGRLFAAKDETIAQTMQSTALNRLASLRAARKSDHPFYWAAFVAMGDWKRY
jgi:tetratricopeptide (TPR) repeat protein